MNTRILVFNRFYYPGYRSGGPVRTIANMVAWLGDEFEFHIVTLDRDVGDGEPYAGIGVHEWLEVAGAKVMYLPSRSLNIRMLAGLARCLNPSVIYLNSFFDPVFTQRVLLARRLRLLNGIPIVIAPRGEFSAGALSLKHWKKACYLGLSRVFGLYRGLIWQASSSLEKVDILQALQFVTPYDVHEAIDLTPIEQKFKLMNHAYREDQRLKICFLSRISPKKNLDFALRALAQVRMDVVLTIYGPKQDAAYWAQCEQLIESMPVNIHVAYAGEVQPSEVMTTLAQHDLFLFPTRGENFGHVIYEALGAGLPVLISDQTPWHHVVERGVGWTLSLDSVSAFAQQIDLCAAWPATRIAEIKRRAQAYAQEIASRGESIDATRRLFHTAMGRVCS